MNPRPASACAALLTAGAVLVGCAANPGPPPVVEPAPDPATTQSSESTVPQAQPARSEATVGVQPLRNGLNPHLLSDESAVVRSIADLVLPSAFVDGEMDTDILASAEIVESTGTAMTVRYVIRDSAQWSDGTPLTGADFNYLWQAMVSTPGVVNPAGYRAISAVRVSGIAGKTVHVDFARPVAEWKGLFRHLVPSHLLGPEPAGFGAGLRNDIPASAGRYMVDDVDRGRGVVILNRNDRFWGEDPARIDILNLSAVRSTTQSADQLRSGQLQFVDTIPNETTRDVYELLPDTQIRMIASPRTLGLSLSATSPVLGDLDAREELRSLIDVPLIARIGAGRSTDLSVADSEPVSEAEPSVLPAAIDEHRPLRLAADPADLVASAAVRSLVDSLNARGVHAEVVATDLTDITARRLPEDTIDGVLTWDVASATALDAAGRLRCPGEDQDYRAGNLSGYCTPEGDELSDDILAGDIPADEGAARVDAIVEQEALWVPLLHEQRLIALGPGIVGADPDLEKWTEGLSSAPSWRLPDELGTTATATPVPPTVPAEPATTRPEGQSDPNDPKDEEQ